MVSHPERIHLDSSFEHQVFPESHRSASLHLDSVASIQLAKPIVSVGEDYQKHGRCDILPADTLTISYKKKDDRRS